MKPHSLRWLFFFFFGAVEIEVLEPWGQPSFLFFLSYVFRQCYNFLFPPPHACFTYSNMCTSIISWWYDIPVSFVSKWMKTRQNKRERNKFQPIGTRWSPTSTPVSNDTRLLTFRTAIKMCCPMPHGAVYIPRYPASRYKPQFCIQSCEIRGANSKRFKITHDDSWFPLLRASLNSMQSYLRSNPCILKLCNVVWLSLSPPLLKRPYSLAIHVYVEHVWVLVPSSGGWTHLPPPVVSTSPHDPENCCQAMQGHLVVCNILQSICLYVWLFCET